MKLLNTYNRISLASTIFIFLLSVAAFYFALHYVLVTQLDEDLKVEQKEIIDYVNEKHTLPRAELVGDQQIVFTASKQMLSADVFETVTSSNSNEKRRQLIFSIKVYNKWNAAIVSKSLKRTDNILRSVVLITLCTIILILAATFITSRKILEKLWQPFYTSLNIVQDFKIGNRTPLQLQPNNIDEFNTMNAALQKSINKALEDYTSLKQFTENASHEMQTPLSIVRSKLEILLQDEHLSEKQSVIVQSATESINKLSRLSSTLLLLTKIENKQFANKEMIDVKEAIDNKIRQFKELWNTKQISVTANLDETYISINTELLELLLNNLFSNATKHNCFKGKINIDLLNNQVIFSNTGAEASLKHEQLFKRFYNPSNNSSGNGLGLALIKQICDTSGFNIFYHYVSGEHFFTIQLNTNQDLSNLYSGATAQNNLYGS